MKPTWCDPARPYAIARRGAGAYAPAGSVQAYEKADILGADFWQVDIRLSCDRELVVCDDAVPVQRIVALAQEKNAGIYADIKQTAAAVPTARLLEQMGVERAVIGGSDAVTVTALRDAACRYPVFARVPAGSDPFATAADVIHLCGQHVLDTAFFKEAGRRENMWWCPMTKILGA